MSIFIRNNERFNIEASAVIAGVRYPNFRDPALREQLSIIEVPEPEPPVDYSEETYFRTEIDIAPYVIYTPKPAEQVAAIQAERARLEALEEARDTARQNVFIQEFIAKTPAEIEQYVDANTATLPAMRAFVKQLALMLLVTAKTEYTDNPNAQRRQGRGRQPR